jgi:hypothetical protein
VTSSIAQSVSRRFQELHPELDADAPTVLLQGFHAAGWTCLGAAGISLLITVVSFHDIGIASTSNVRQSNNELKVGADLQLEKHSDGAAQSAEA